MIIFLSTVLLLPATTHGAKNTLISCTQIKHLGRSNHLKFLDPIDWPSNDIRVFTVDIDSDKRPDKIVVDSTNRREPTYTITLGNGSTLQHSFSEVRAGTPFTENGHTYIATGISTNNSGFLRFIDFAAWEISGTTMRQICSEPGVSA